MVVPLVQGGVAFDWKGPKAGCWGAGNVVSSSWGELQEGVTLWKRMELHA